MRRKLAAAWKILTCKGYILCTIKDPKCPDYDHNVTPSTVLKYNQYLIDFYQDAEAGGEAFVNEVKDLLGNA